MKQIIKLTEENLHRIINKCVNEALNEIGDTNNGQFLLGRLAARKHTQSSPQFKTASINRKKEKIRKSGTETDSFKNIANYAGKNSHDDDSFYFDEGYYSQLWNERKNISDERKSFLMNKFFEIQKRYEKEGVKDSYGFAYRDMYNKYTDNDVEHRWLYDEIEWLRCK